MNEPLTWLNPPTTWRRHEQDWIVSTDDKTDFWRKTEYGFIHDNGHFAYRTLRGDFSLEVTFTGRYQALFDQAGLMIRLDPERWIKSGIEFVDQSPTFSTVVTNDTSDWSLIPLSGALAVEPVRARLIRTNSTVSAAFRRSHGPWQTARVAGFPSDPQCQVGIMCCSPQRAGFEVRFSDLVIEPRAGQ